MVLRVSRWWSTQKQAESDVQDNTVNWAPTLVGLHVVNVTKSATQGMPTLDMSEVDSLWGPHLGVYNTFSSWQLRTTSRADVDWNCSLHDLAQTTFFFCDSDPRQRTEPNILQRLLTAGDWPLQYYRHFIRTTHPVQYRIEEIQLWGLFPVAQSISKVLNVSSHMRLRLFFVLNINHLQVQLSCVLQKLMPNSWKKNTKPRNQNKPDP